MGSALERQDALLIDLDAPGDGLLHREEWSRNLEFSPDGRWLRWNAFTPDGETSRYATPLVDRSTIELLALTDVATDGTGCWWSPDSTKIACTTPNTDDSNFRLSFRSVTDASIGPESLIGQAAEPYTNWVGATRFTYHDTNGELFVADFDDAVVSTRAYLPELQAAGGPLRISSPYGSWRAVVEDSTHQSYIVDLSTDAWQELPKYRYQMYSPELDFIVSSDGTSVFLHALDGMIVVGPLDISGAGGFSLSARIDGTFAPHSLRFAATANGRVIVSTLVAEALENTEIAGAYTTPIASHLTSSPDERWVAIVTATEVWLCDLSAPGPFEAVKLGEQAQAMVSFAPDSSALVFVSAAANNPSMLTVVELGSPLVFSTRAFESEYKSGSQFGQGQWSNDNSYFLLRSVYADGSETLYAFDMLDPRSPARLIASCDGSGGSEPSCPSGGYFQPWVAWASAGEP